VSPHGHPEAQAEGSLGTGVPREDKKGGVPREDKNKSVPRKDTVGNVAPSLFLSPRGQAEGSPWGVVPKEVSYGAPSRTK
jgi:hypothetical protein